MAAPFCRGLKPKGNPWCPPLGVVWLTANADPEFMFARDDGTLDPEWKTGVLRCRITVVIPSTDKRLMRWEKWLRKQHSIQLPNRKPLSVEQYIDARTAFQWKNYFVYFGAILLSKIRAIEYANPMMRATERAKAAADTDD